MELCLLYVNHQKRNNLLGITLIIHKFDDILLIYLHLTYFFYWICSIANDLGRLVMWVKAFWINWKVPCLNPTKYLAKLREPKVLQGSRWPSCRQKQWLTLAEWGSSLNNGPSLAMGEPNSRRKFFSNFRKFS